MPTIDRERVLLLNDLAAALRDALLAAAPDRFGFLLRRYDTTLLELHRAVAPERRPA